MIFVSRVRVDFKLYNLIQLKRQPDMQCPKEPKLLEPRLPTLFILKPSTSIRYIYSYQVSLHLYIHSLTKTILTFSFFFPFFSFFF